MSRIKVPVVWASLVLTNNGYVDGAMVCAYSIKHFLGTTEPCICLVDSSIYNDVKDRLLKVFDDVVPITPILIATNWTGGPRFESLYRPWIAKCMSKYALLQPNLPSCKYTYDKAIFLDADSCVARTTKREYLEQLKSIPAPAGILSKAIYTTGKVLDEKSVMTSLQQGYGIRGAPLILEPSAADYDAVLTFAKNGWFYPSIAGPDEVFQSTHYRNRLRHLDEGYCHKWGTTIRAVIRHYPTDKPWGSKDWPDMADWHYYHDLVQSL